MANQNRNLSKGKRKPSGIRTDKKYTRKNSTKNQRRDAEAVNTIADIAVSKSNPYAWYANFPNYAKDVATVAFGNPVGSPIRLNPATNDDIVAAGVMTLNFTPTPGVSQNLSSPINRQAIRLYSYLRSIQRSASTYDAADLMMYLLAVDSLYMYWAFLRRAYGVAQLFTPTNTYYPKVLLQGMGIDPNSILANLADFRAYINRFALNIGRFAMPKQFDLLQRHMWMTSGLYLDSDTTRAQTYMFVPFYYYKYDNTVTTGSKLTGVTWDATVQTPATYNFSQLVQFGTQLITNMDNDEDTLNISGDLYRAYGGEVFSVEETSENYAILPVYDKTVLSQIENCTVVGAFSNADGSATVAPEITQNPSVGNGAIIFAPIVTAGRAAFTPFEGGNDKIGINFPFANANKVMNMHFDAPTPEMVMEATRLLAATNSAGLIFPNFDTAVRPLTACGSEVINFMRYATMAANQQPIWNFVASNTMWLTQGTLANYNQIATFTQFDWAPMLYICGDADPNNTLINMSADLDNFTSLTYDTLNNIHDAALLSLLDSPQPIKS